MGGIVICVIIYYNLAIATKTLFISFILNHYCLLKTTDIGFEPIAYL